MTQEEKARRYDEALKAARDVYTYYCDDREQLRKIESIFPELKESEDEKIRKELLSVVNNLLILPDEQKSRLIAWLEKQVSQDNAEDADIWHRFSFYLYKDEPNVLYLSGLYVNEEYRNKGIGTKILEVADEVAKSLSCNAIRLKTKKDSDAERLYRTHGYNSLATEDKDEIWLEKQDEQKPIKEHNVCDFCEEKASCINPCPMKLIEQEHADKIEPKFKVGDWVVHDMSDDRKAIRQIVNMTNKSYVLDGEDFNTFYFDDLENNYHLWTIQDAKDGNVLFTSSTASHETFIFKSIDEKGNAKCYFAYDSEDGFREGKYHFIGRATDCKPTTKEQRDLLFKKMHEAGYKWNADTLTLEKIEKPSTIKFNEPDIDAMVEEYWNNEDRLISSHTRAMIEEAYRQGLEDMYKRLSRKIKEVNNEREL